MIWDNKTTGFRKPWRPVDMCRKRDLEEGATKVLSRFPKVSSI
jgi:hypothetical protein